MISCPINIRPVDPDANAAQPLYLEGLNSIVQPSEPVSVAPIGATM